MTRLNKGRQVLRSPHVCVGGFGLIYGLHKKLATILGSLSPHKSRSCSWVSAGSAGSIRNLRLRSTELLLPRVRQKSRRSCALALPPSSETDANLYFTTTSKPEVLRTFFWFFLQENLKRTWGSGRELELSTIFPILRLSLNSNVDLFKVVKYCPLEAEHKNIQSSC